MSGPCDRSCCLSSSAARARSSEMVISFSPFMISVTLNTVSGSRPRISSENRATSYFDGSRRLAVCLEPFCSSRSTVRFSRLITSCPEAAVNTVGSSGFIVSARNTWRQPPPLRASPMYRMRLGKSSKKMRGLISFSARAEMTPYTISRNA